MRGDLQGQAKDLSLNSDEQGSVVAQHGESKDQQDKDEAVSVEKQQEILLINKMAAGGKLPPKNQSSFLQKKLQQRKFFDSGDYAMNQNKEKKHIQQHPPTVVAPPQIATPMTAPAPAAKLEESASNTSNKSLEELRPPTTSLLSVGGSVDAGDSDDEGQLQIPRPDTVPQRKASILHPSVHSKLSPQPHIHHDYNDESITAPPQ